MCRAQVAKLHFHYALVHIEKPLKTSIFLIFSGLLIQLICFIELFCVINDSPPIPLFIDVSAISYLPLHQFYTTYLIFSTSSRINSSVACTYKSIVTLIVECPSIACRTFGCIPLSIHLVAKVCRNACIYNG